MAARREALAADLVVVNHHLFFADVVLKDEGMAELLPACNTVILDEAHQLPDTATLFFGATLSSASVELARDARRNARGGARDGGAPAPAALEKGARDCDLSFPAKGRAHRGVGLPRARFPDAVAAFARRSPGLAESSRFSPSGARGCALPRPGEPRRSRPARTLAGRRPAIWSEDRVRGTLPARLTPLRGRRRSSATEARRPRAWIFTSATLAVGEDFSHFLGRIGAPTANAVRIESPFDFESQAMIYLPEGMPDPASREYTARVVDGRAAARRGGGRAQLPAVHEPPRARRGRARCSRREPGSASRYPLLVQGEAPRESLLAALSRARQRRAARHRELLGGRGRAWPRARARRHRQAAVRRARGSAAQGAARGHPAPRRQSVPGIPAAAGGARAQAGIRPPDPRPRRTSASSCSAIRACARAATAALFMSSLPPATVTTDLEEAASFLRRRLARAGVVVPAALEA